MFITTQKPLEEFNQMMIDEFPNIYWAASTRANHVTKEAVAELARGNCFSLGWGFESGSQRMLDLMKKRVSRETNINAYKNIDNSPLHATPSLMVGNVGETNQTIQETIKSIKEARIAFGGVFYATPYPGGRTWDWAFERGLIQNTHQYLLDGSDTDAAELTINLTPYPDWILKAWNRQVVAAYQRNSIYRFFLGKRNFRAFKNQTKPFLVAMRKQLGGLFPNKIPFFIHHATTQIYCYFFDLRAKLFPSDRDILFKVKADDKGALLPNNLLVANTQRHLNDDKLKALLSKGTAKTLLSDDGNPFVDGVHAKVFPIGIKNKN